MAVPKGYSAHLSGTTPLHNVLKYALCLYPVDGASHEEDGEPMDYDLAVFALFSHRDLVQNVSAETSES